MKSPELRVRRLGDRAPWRRLSHPTLLLVAAVFIAVALFDTGGTSYSVYILDTVLLAAVGAIALDLLMGTGGQVSIGNAGFVALGAFATVWAARIGIPFPLDVVLSGLVCAVGGLLVGLPALRIRGMYLALATLAAFYIAQFIGQDYQTHAVGAAGFFLKPVFRGTIAHKSESWSWLLAGVLALTIVLASWLRGGRTGRAWRMIRDHEVAASMMGIPVARYKLILFVVTSTMIGVQGGLMARFLTAVTYDSFTLALSISVIAMILIGGLDSLLGPVIGAAVVTTLPIFVPELVGHFVSPKSSARYAGAYSEIIYGAGIMLFIIAAPRGLNGLIRSLSGKLLAFRASMRAGSQRAGVGSTKKDRAEPDRVPPLTHAAAGASEPAE